MFNQTVGMAQEGGQTDQRPETELRAKEAQWLNMTLGEAMQEHINGLLNQAVAVKVRMDKLPMRTLAMTRRELREARMSFEPYHWQDSCEGSAKVLGG